MKKGLFKILLFILLLLPLSAKAEVKFALSKSADNLKPGSNFSVTIKVTGVDSVNAVTNFSLNLNYKSSALTYTGGESGIANIGVNGENITIAYDAARAGSSIGNNFDAATLNFTINNGVKSGDYALSLNSGCEINGAAASCSSNSTSINVAALSGNANLNSLKIPNATLKPAFDKNTTEYDADIKDITEITINATAQDPNAKIQVSDNYKSLVKGENIVKIVVTSENGTTKTYTIKVNLTLTPTDEEKLKADASLKSITIKGQKIDFKSDEKKYYLNVKYDIKKLTIKAEPTNPNATVKITGQDKLLVGKNTIKIEVKSEDETTNDTYQIIVNREEEKKQITKTCPDSTSTREWIIFSISMLVTFTLGIVLGFFLCKKDILVKIKNKLFKKKNKEEPVAIETLSDTIDLSNVKKEIKKDNKKKQ